MARRSIMTRGTEADCPIRAIVRMNIRHHLQKEGYQELADKLYMRSACQDEAAISPFPAMVAFRGILINLQEERKNDFIQLIIDLRSFQGTPERSFELYKNIANRLWTKPSFGRIASLVAFSGFAAVEMAGHGREFLAAVVSKVEDDVDERVHSWLAQSGRTMELFARDTSEVKSWDWRKPLHALGGVAALAGSAFVLAAVLAKS